MGRSFDPMATFLMRFELLEAFVHREGHACVPVAHKESGFNLGRWVAAQRSHYSSGNLPDECAALLEGLHGWVWRASDFRWDEGIACMASFKAREGHILVPNNHVENRFMLGEWIARQKKRMAHGRLTPTQVEQFMRFGDVNKSWRDKRNQDRWERRFQLLVNYAKRHGESTVPRHHIEEGIALGVWVNSLRSQYTRGALALDLVKRLESLPNWAWARPRAKKTPDK